MSSYFHEPRLFQDIQSNRDGENFAADRIRGLRALHRLAVVHRNVRFGLELADDGFKADSAANDKCDGLRLGLANSLGRAALALVAMHRLMRDLVCQSREFFSRRLAGQQRDLAA